MLVSEIGDMQVVKQVSEMRQRLSKNINKSSTLYEIKLGVGRLQDLELLIQMGSLLHKNFRIISPYLMIRQLHEQNFFSESEAKICEETYVLYSALQQILSLTVTGLINNASIKSINNMLKTHNLTPLQKNIDKSLSEIAKSIDNIFKKKLQNV